MDTKLEVILTQTFDRKPLVTVSNFPGLNADLTPVQMRALATALCMAAEESQLQPMEHKHFSRKKRVYHMMISK